MKIFNRLCGIILSIAMAFSLVTVAGVNEAYAADEFIISDTGVLTKYQGVGGDVVIPKTVKAIGENAFLGNATVTSVKMSDNVTSIGEYAFDSCTALKSIDFSKNLVSIETGAFYKCSSLAKIDLPAKLKKIGNSVFAGCTSLDGINVPDSVKEIGSYAIGFHLTGGYDKAENFAVMGGKVAKEYAQKYDLTYITINDLKVKPTLFTKGKKNTAKLFWEKNAIVDKVQLQYSTTKSFKNKKTFSIVNSEVTDKFIKGLKKDKAYYARVRGVKKVGGTTYTSAWSKVIKLS